MNVQKSQCILEGLGEQKLVRDGQPFVLKISLVFKWKKNLTHDDGFMAGVRLLMCNLTGPESWFI